MTIKDALKQAFNEEHQRRAGCDAHPGRINNSMKHIERDPIWKRVLEIMGE